MVNSENIYVKEFINARTYKEEGNWYMELVFVDESGYTYIIPKVGPIISDDEYITIKDLFEETYSRHMAHRPIYPSKISGGIGILQNTYDIFMVPHFNHLDNTGKLVTVTDIYIVKIEPKKSTKKKMTLKDIEKELGYEIDLVEEVDPK